ncbi:hypothetical protein TanjilG_31967 [Lupinus angustifolius]|uniref:Uncharacterized protein n=1 Tax=Lupinus angustifolius TaxID=3871 RepID=A0A1J7H6X4_LUPAN|nr:hypothetical protein TanjilG_31967 [Lupinus angustifolius]
MFSITIATKSANDPVGLSHRASTACRMSTELTLAASKKPTTTSRKHNRL